jgi:hypothetical protein
MKIAIKSLWRLSPLRALRSFLSRNTMPTTHREIVILVIVSLLLCDGLVWMAQQAATATAAQRLRLAAPGVLYPIEYVSSKTNSGVIAFLPGRPLHVVEDKGDTILVSDGKTKGEVSADELTNDLDIAALAAQQDAQEQQQLADYLASREGWMNFFAHSKMRLLTAISANLRPGERQAPCLSELRTLWSTVRYGAVNAMLLNEFLKEHRTLKEQQKEIDALKAELKEQKAQINPPSTNKI